MKRDTRFTLQQGVCFALLADLLPRDGSWVLLVDPPFTETEEFEHIARWLAEVVQSHPRGITALWFTHMKLLETLSRLLPAPTLTGEFQPQYERRRMCGSGVRIINPPQNLTQQIKRGAPEIASLLAGTISVEFEEGKSAALAS